MNRKWRATYEGRLLMCAQFIVSTDSIKATLGASSRKQEPLSLHSL